MLNSYQCIVVVHITPATWWGHDRSQVILGRCRRRTMYKDLENIEIHIKCNGGLICDTRKSITNPRYVGGIVQHPLRPGYCFCPLTLRTFVFNRKIPRDNFRTPERAGEWLKRHSVCYTNRRYTIFNPLIKYFFELPSTLVSDIRIQLVLLYFLISMLLFFYPSQPGNVVGVIFLKLFAAVFAAGALINAYIFLRGR